MSERDVAAYLSKANECLAGAASECTDGRYNNCANRAYYACFQAAVAALVREGVTPPGGGTRWRHEFVQARFAGNLVNGRKLYPEALRQTLIQTMRLRHTADYHTDQVSAIPATRGLARARAFVDAVKAKGET